MKMKTKIKAGVLGCSVMNSILTSKLQAGRSALPGAVPALSFRGVSDRYLPSFAPVLVEADG